MLQSVKNMNKNEKIFFILSLLFLFLFFMLPCIIAQGNVVISTHDSYDHVNAWMEMLKENGLLFSVTGETSCFMGMPSMYYGHVNFSFYTLLFYIFDNLTANIVAYCLSIFISFFSMFLLLNFIWKDRKLIVILGSVIYASLACLPFLCIALSTLPLFFYLLLRFSYRNIKTSKVFLLMFFPFFSDTMLLGVFLLAVWFVSIFVYRIREKKWNKNLIIGLFILIAGFVFVDFKTFYMMICGKEVLNRSVFVQDSPFFKTFFNYLFKGVDPAYCWQLPFLLPFILFVLVFVIIGKMTHKKSNQYMNIKNDFIILVMSLIVIVFFCFLAALYDSGLISGIIRKILPFLDGFNFGRFVFINRLLWNIAFIAALVIVDKLFRHKIIAILFGLCQLLIVSVLVVPFEKYHMGPRTLLNYAVLKPLGIDKNYELYTYNDFYSRDLFETVKKDINYKGENTVAFGFHPAVLMLNGFNTVDGYLNCYPLKYMQEFRKILEPEFEKNIKDRNYYDSWGGRMYLYNSEVDYAITREKNVSPVELKINENVLKNEFNVKYLISRVRIKNSKEKQLKLIKEYEDSSYFYDLYIYSF